MGKLDEYVGQALQHEPPLPDQEVEHFRSDQTVMYDSALMGPQVGPNMAMYRQIGTGPKPRLTASGKVRVLDVADSVMELFPKVDLNNDGVLSRDEITDAKTNPAIQADPVERETLRVLGDHFETWRDMHNVNPYRIGGLRTGIGADEVRSFTYMARDYKSFANFHMDVPAKVGLLIGVPVGIVAGQIYGITSVAAEAGMAARMVGMTKGMFAGGLILGLAGLAIGAGIGYCYYKQAKEPGINSLLRDLSGTGHMVHPETFMFKERTWLHEKPRAHADDDPVGLIYTPPR